MEYGMDIRTYCLEKLERQRKDMLLIRQMAQPRVVDALNKRIAVLNEIFNFETPIRISEIKPKKAVKELSFFG